jgi:hypothetical protein
VTETTTETRTPAEETRAAVRALRDGKPLTQEAVEHVADLLDLMADAMENDDAEELTYTRPDGATWSHVAPSEGFDRDIRSDWTAALTAARSVNGKAA